jgi:hypothetical protein
MSQEYLAIESEIAQIEGIIKNIPDRDIIKKISFQSRLQSAKNALATMARYQISKKAKLTFRGKPVVGSHGMTAEFGSKAAQIFADAYAAVAAGLGERLRYMGPIPDRAKNQLLITGTAIGSFGFEFELPSHREDLLNEEPHTDQALKKLQDLMQTSAEGSDDQISELVDEIHPRAVSKVHDFLNYLAQQQAWCGLEFDGAFFRYSDIDQLRISADRLLEGNIRETNESIVGFFSGILPNDRTFEFTEMGSKGVTKGKIAPEIEDPEILLRDFYRKRVTAIFSVLQVGQGRPRYRLNSLDQISLMNGDGTDLQLPVS